MAWQKLARLDELPDGAIIEVLEGKQPYALCNVSGEIRAMWGTCPHHGGPLGQGGLERGVVTCPWHAWPFDSASGQCLISHDLRIPTFPVRIEGNDVMVDLPDAVPQKCHA